ncbi:MAG: hypothetical protein JW876_09185 [Candidatus Krumholzibacteriota bacterium]|nr:hypothetical protein [Candidatus Krumholzibacteriota bacterium]
MMRLPRAWLVFALSVAVVARAAAADAENRGAAREGPVKALSPPGAAPVASTVWALRIPAALSGYLEEKIGGAGEPFGVDGPRLSRVSGARHTAPAIPVLLEDATFLPVLAGRLGDLLVATPTDLLRPVHLGFRLLGAPAGGYGPPTTDTPGIRSLPATEREAAAAIIELTGENRVPDGWERLPIGARRIVVGMLRAARAASARIEESRVDAIAALGTAPAGGGREENAGMIDLATAPWRDRNTAGRGGFDAIDAFDLRALSHGTRLFLEHMRPCLADTVPVSSGFDGEPVFFDTPFGGVAIFGVGDDLIDTDRAFIVDLGGDDLYRGAPGSTGPGRPPVAVVVDLGGDDRYECAYGPALGFFGLGALFDLGGDDRYRTETHGIGAGFFGSGILVDRDGDDRYAGGGFVTQGAGRIGLGFLADLAGDDEYRCAGRGQGFGSTLGCGILFDAGGSDLYASRPDDRGSYGAFVQGASLGRRADLADGRSLAGGFGLLVDAAGDDRYDAGDWSLGAAYWWGIGLVEDRDGSDRWRSGSYSLGAAAHYGAGCCVDLNGDDVYNDPDDDRASAQFQGYAHDGSVAAFVDLSGDDGYTHRNRSAGSADRHAVALFWDRSGDDRYLCMPGGRFAGDRAYGAVPPGETPSGEHGLLLRETWSATGIFLDTGGRDEYVSATPSTPPLLFGEGGRWRHGRGIGVDAELVPPGPVAKQNTAREAF